MTLRFPSDEFSGWKDGVDNLPANLRQGRLIGSRRRTLPKANRQAKAPPLRAGLNMTGVDDRLESGLGRDS